VIGDVLSPTHLIFILVVALLVLGPKRLPEVGRSLGRGIRDFRGALTGEDEHESSAAVSSREPDLTPVTPATTALDAEEVELPVAYGGPEVSTQSASEAHREREPDSPTTETEPPTQVVAPPAQTPSRSS
jgi:sec-independent protein translocase protein TatA